MGYVSACSFLVPRTVYFKYSRHVAPTRDSASTPKRPYPEAPRLGRSHRCERLPTHRDANAQMRRSTPSTCRHTCSRICSFFLFFFLCFPTTSQARTNNRPSEASTATQRHGVTMATHFGSRFYSCSFAAGRAETMGPSAPKLFLQFPIECFIDKE